VTVVTRTLAVSVVFALLAPSAVQADDVSTQRNNAVFRVTGIT
jgi:hypothetical protein